MGGGQGAAPMRVLVIDDQLLFAELLAAALDREPDLVSSGLATDVSKGVALCHQLQPDAVILDVDLTDGDSFAAASAILQRNPQTRVIMLAAQATTDVFERAAAAGACGFLTKDGSLATMLQTVRHARPGGLLVDPALVAELASRRRELETGHQHIPALTPRERVVLELLGQGKDVKAMAKELNLSPLTCRGYVKTLLSKLGAHSQLEAVAIATRLGLVRRTHES